MWNILIFKWEVEWRYLLKTMDHDTIINSHMSQKLKSLANNEFHHLTLIQTILKQLRELMNRKLGLLVYERLVSLIFDLFLRS